MKLTYRTLFVVILFQTILICTMEIEPPCPHSSEPEVKNSLPITGPQLIAIIHNHQPQALYMHSNTSPSKIIPKQTKQEVSGSLVYDGDDKCYKADYVLSKSPVHNKKQDELCLRLSVTLTALANSYKAESFLYKAGTYYMQIASKRDAFFPRHHLPGVTKIPVVVHNIPDHNYSLGSITFE